MKKFLRELFYWLSAHKWRCPVEGCLFKAHANNEYIIDMVRDAHERHHGRKES